MQSKQSRCFKTLCFFLLMPLLLAACKTGVIMAEPLYPLDGIEKILVMPFENVSAVYGEGNNARCPVCGKVFLTGTIQEGSDVMLTRHLVSFIKSNTDINIIYPNQAQMDSDDFKSGNESKSHEVNKLKESGRLLGADAVMTGHLYRFNERIGTTYSVVSPASVAFDLHLIGVSSGRVLWAGHVDETQRSLSENLFEIGSFIKRKGEWVSADDLATSGLDDLLIKLFKK
ncbi:MAG: penicillin-binding protein activator LpoB [Proteobacteria bacterium]|nr:penicillin-binding protein activator LpoB [Pseudomonadota bacterium]MBU1713315.1 penicillin-binding protein activator LpoB [Pseudomonadota bacterium]